MISTIAKALPETTGSQGAPKTKSPKTKAVGKVQSGRAGTKQGNVLALLEHGTTIEAVMRATGWQQHSVRGFFAGVVRKKLGLNLTSKQTAGGRIYRVNAGKPANLRKNGSRKTR